MAAGDWIPYLLGTIRSVFKIGKSTLDASGVSAARTHTLPDIAGTLALTSDLAAYQPLDSDLTAIAALSTQTFGRSLLTYSNGYSTFDVLTIQSTDIASAGTTTLAASVGFALNVTGTATITSFGANTAGAMRLVTFTDVGAITHDGTALKLPTSANITRAAGDRALLRGLGGSNWECCHYTRADGTSLVNYIRVDGSVAFTADQSMGSHKLTSVTDPASAQDAATKNYVDMAVAALEAKNECQAATTAALAASTYNNGSSGVGATITLTVAAVLILDGYTPALNDRLLIKNQASAVQNGIFSVTTLGTALINAVLTRTTDFNQPGDGINGALVYVLNGTANANTLWSCTTAGSITFGTTNINWSQFTGTTYTADESTLHLAGTVFSVLKAPILSTARAINGTNFDGSAAITITAAAGTLTGTTLNSTVVSSSLTSVGTLASLMTILSDSGTNTAAAVVTIGHNTSGTAAASFGSITKFQLQDSTTASTEAGDITVTWATATHASRKARVVHNVYDTVIREGMRIEASGTAPMIGFLGASASAALASPDLGTLATTFGLATGTPTFAAANLSGTALPAGLTATQAAQETSTSTVLAVTPGVQQYHPSACKAWLSWDTTGTTIRANYNCSSITRTGVGVWAINFTTAFSSASYGAVCSCDLSNGVYLGMIGVDLGAVPTASKLSLRGYNASGLAAHDMTYANAACFGDQ